MIGQSKIVKSAVFIGLFLIVSLHFYLTRMTLNPYYGKVFYKMGIECQDGCGLNRRLDYFKKAVSYDPNLSDVYYDLALTYDKENKYNEEIESYKKVTQLDSSNWRAYLELGAHYSQINEPDYALRYLLKSESHRKYTPNTEYEMVKINYCLAKAYDQKKMYKEALDCYINLIYWKKHLKEVCDRIWKISKISGQQDMVLEQVGRLRYSPEQVLQQEQMVQYIKTDKIPEFLALGLN